MIRRRDVWPLFALGFLLAVTAAWWALALWPVPGGAPAWLERTRAVCFNATASGLPDVSGWILLVGQPVGMLAVLMAVWHRDVVGTLRHLARFRPGRGALGGALALILLGLTAAGVRVASAGIPDPVLPGDGAVPTTYPRLDRPWPGTSGLVDQDGRPFSLARLDGRAAFVTFAYAHCTTICPLVVHSALKARGELTGERDLAVVVLTLDPWRDTPSRLGDIATQWTLGPDDFALSGDVELANSVLDQWGVPRQRDERTGDLSHPAVVYLVEPDGTLAYASTGATDQLVALARRMK